MSGLHPDDLRDMALRLDAALDAIERELSVPHLASDPTLLLARMDLRLARRAIWHAANHIETYLAEPRR